MTTTTNVRAGRIAAYTFLSWAGGFIHHRLELPQLSLLSPEHVIPALMSVALFLAWWRLPYKRLAALALLTWALFPQLLGGGILSVLPFDFWPFDPPQTLEHYAVHALYAAAQLPLIVALIRQLRAMNRRGQTAGAKA